ncbi:MAG: YIP1 family protein [Chloroflexi bacterium]|nr:YIP1 family protein [Chloroflexota bacterium]
MLDRLMGVITLKPAVYREIAHDQNATGQAAIIVVVMALFSGIVGAIVLAAMSSSLPPGTAIGSPVGSAIRTIITAIISWLIGAWVIAFVSKTFFGGKTDTGEMLRVFGFTQIFQVIAIVPCIGTIVALVLSLIGAVIGIREASEFDTTKAILTGIVAFVILLIVSAILGLFLAFLG